MFGSSSIHFVLLMHFIFSRCLFSFTLCSACCIMRRNLWRHIYYSRLNLIESCEHLNIVVDSSVHLIPKSMFDDIPMLNYWSLVGTDLV